MVLKRLPLASGCQKWPQPRAASSDLGFLKRSYSLEAGIKFLRNQILCIHTKFQPNRTMGTPPNKLCNIRGYSRPKWRSKFIPPSIFQLIMKIQVFFDINLAREVRRQRRHPFKRCHELGCFSSNSNIELGIESADWMVDQKYFGIITTSYGGFVPTYWAADLLTPLVQKNVVFRKSLC